MSAPGGAASGPAGPGPLAIMRKLDAPAFRASLEGLALQAPHEEAADDVRAAGARILARLEAGPIAPGPEEPARARRLAVALQWLAQVARKARRFELAAACLHEAVCLNPTPELWVGLFNLLEDAQALEDLVPLLRSALGTEVAPERRRELYRRLGRALEEGLRHYEEAARVYEAAVQEFPDSPRFLQDRARCLEALREYPALLAVVERQLTLDPDPHRQALLHARAATLLETLGNPRRAKEHYRAAFKLAPKLDTPFQGLLALAEAQGDHPAVVQLLRERLKVEGRPRERATILHRLGELYANVLQDPEQACLFLERAIREHPRAHAPRLLLLALLCADRQFARAERFATPPDLTETQGLSAEELARLCEFRATVANERGRPVEAVECLCLALQLSTEPDRPLQQLLDLVLAERPELPPPPELFAFAALQAGWGGHLRAARALHAASLLDAAWGRLPRAEASLQQALRLDPSDPALSRALAALYQTARRHREAADVLLRAAGAHPEQAPALTVEAARVLADHLQGAAEARGLLRELRATGRADAEARVLEAGLAWSLGARDEAAAYLAELRRGPPDGPSPSTLEGTVASSAARLELELAQAEGMANEIRTRVQESCARAGAPRLLREVLSRRLQEGGVESLDDFVDTVASSARAPALRIAGDVLRQAGREEPARYYAQRALIADGSSLDILESLALVAPDEAIPRLKTLLEEQPFHARAAALLSSLLSAAGDAPRGEALMRVALALRGELTPARPWELARFFRASPEADPLLEALRSLRGLLAEPFDRDERALYTESRPVALPRALEPFWAELAQHVGRPLPELRVGRAAGRTPLVLLQPLALVLSPVLFHRDMPRGALAISLLRGVGSWLGGAGPLTWSSLYRLDVLGEALRLAERRPERAGSMLAEALEAPAELCTEALSSAHPLTQGRRTDFVAAGAQYDERLLRAALLATSDLTGALAAVSLHAPARLAPLAAGERWGRLLARIPQARSVLGCALTDDFAELFGPLTSPPPG